MELMLLPLAIVPINSKMIYSIPNIDIFTHTDWSRVTQALEHITDKINRKELDHKAWMEDAYKSTFYPLGNYGGVFQNFDLTEGSQWNIWTGNFLETFLPWSKKLRSIFESSPLDFNGFCFGRHTQSIKSHIDGKKIGEAPRGHCNLNYLVYCENPNSYTYAISANGEEHRYYSHSNTAWLLATDVLHGVQNEGIRDVFQLKFFSPFVEVKNWLQDHPDVFSK